MDIIGQEHDLLQRDIDQYEAGNSLHARINKWEQRSIEKIQLVAETTRADLQALLDKNKNELKKSVSKITNELQSCRGSDDYTEIDIGKWTQQLQALREILESPSTIHIHGTQASKSIIHLIKVSDQPQQRSLNSVDEPPPDLISAVIEPSYSDERFDEIVGKAKMYEEGLMVTNSSNFFLRDPIIYGTNRYTSGAYRIDFRMDKIGHLCSFFGVTTSSTKMKRAYDRDESLYGWWDLDQVVVTGIAEESKCSNYVQTGDDITLIMDCSNQQIQLRHHRTNRLLQLPVNIKKCPFPWKTVIQLQSKGDSVRILPRTA
jgi:hypothetical protein